jgi:transcriptional regulator with XRE-family HTH domain
MGMAMENTQDIGGTDSVAEPKPIEIVEAALDVADALRELRIRARLSQHDVSTRSGIFRPNISRIESGRHTPSLETILRLLRVYGGEISVGVNSLGAFRVSIKKEKQ